MTWLTWPRYAFHTKALHWISHGKVEIEGSSMPKPALCILKYQLNSSNDMFKDNIPFKLIRNTEK